MHYGELIRVAADTRRGRAPTVSCRGPASAVQPLALCCLTLRLRQFLAGILGHADQLFSVAGSLALHLCWVELAMDAVGDELPDQIARGRPVQAGEIHQELLLKRIDAKGEGRANFCGHVPNLSDRKVQLTE
jgi:hypothetical protein